MTTTAEMALVAEMTSAASCATMVEASSSMSRLEARVRSQPCLQGDAMWVRLLMIGLVLTTVVSQASGADDKPPRIKAEDARQHAGKKVEVVFEVKATKNSTKRKTVFLDSETDFNNRNNLGIAISEKGVEDLKKVRGVSTPEDFYKGKKIQVTGEVVIEDDRVYIKVNSADQLDVAKE